MGNFTCINKLSALESDGLNYFLISAFPGPAEIIQNIDNNGNQSECSLSMHESQHKIITSIRNLQFAKEEILRAEAEITQAELELAQEKKKTLQERKKTQQSEKRVRMAEAELREVERELKKLEISFR